MSLSAAGVEHQALQGWDFQGGRPSADVGRHWQADFGSRVFGLRAAKVL
jgi:hypothetical protein